MNIDEHMHYPRYWQSLDFAAHNAEYPPPPDFFSAVYRKPRDQLRQLQEKRFLATVRRGWEIPFYRRHWSNAGIEPGDVTSLDDIEKIPPYSVHDIRESIERNPPFGDFMGIPLDGPDVMPLVLHTSGGTTGLPRPMLYTPQDRETMAVLSARRYVMQGMRPGDLALATLSLGLSNGGFGARDGIWKYTGAIPVMTGSGASTPTRRQIEIMQQWKIDILLGFPAYMRHMAHLARDEMNLDPRSLGVRAICSHIGIEDRAEIEELWGAPCFDSYGTNEAGIMAAECVHKTGMHINEDAVLLEVADLESGKMLPVGEKGTLYITTLYRWGAPQIRFNVNDISRLLPAGCACGSTLLNLDRIQGRSDNMVKVRGANVFAEAIGVAVAEDKRSNGEYFCVVDRAGSDAHDELTVMVEVPNFQQDAQAVSADLVRRLKEVIGIRANVTAVAARALEEHTGTATTSKIKRLVDRRK